MHMPAAGCVRRVHSVAVCGPKRLWPAPQLSRYCSHRGAHPDASTARDAQEWQHARHKGPYNGIATAELLLCPSSCSNRSHILIGAPFTVMSLSLDFRAPCGARGNATDANCSVPGSQGTPRDMLGLLSKQPHPSACRRQCMPCSLPHAAANFPTQNAGRRAPQSYCNPARVAAWTAL